MKRIILISIVINFLLLCTRASAHAQEPTYDPSERDYWIERYLSVSYPLKSISVNSKFGSRKDPFSGKSSSHGGIDLAARSEDVMAMFDGQVISTGSDGRSGKFVIIRHGRYTVSYCHLSKILVSAGDDLLAGDVVGVTGNTGRSTGEHLHITVKESGKQINPYDILLYVREVRKEAFLALGGVIEGDMEPQEFIDTYAPYAVQEQKEFGIPASVTLAQMALESAWGKSKLAIKANNFFGIKAYSTWISEGRPYVLQDDDKKDEEFCEYNAPQESIRHHSHILMGERYSKCRNYGSRDYHNWLMEIKAAGYATRKDYVSVCEKIIKKYKLYLYDYLLDEESEDTL